MEAFSIGWWFVLISLAAWRVTHLFADEDGPGDVVVKLRARLGNSFAGRAMDCFFCISLWIAAPFAFIVARDLLTWCVMWLAISGTVCLLQRATEASDSRSSDRRVRQGEDPDVLLRSETSSAPYGELPTRSAPASGDAPESDEPHLSRYVGIRN